jgi:hypothetical protein
MGLKVFAAGVCVAVIAATPLAVVPAQAQTQIQTKKQQSVATTTRGATAKQRPRARIVVAPRSFLDAGTEVAPGERKFTDYAFPLNYSPLSVVTNTGGRVGWDNSPLPSGSFYSPGRNNSFGW